MYSVKLPTYRLVEVMAAMMMMTQQWKMQMEDNLEQITIELRAEVLALMLLVVILEKKEKSREKVEQTAEERR